jgi:4-amino-4-deoxy-L-arabinose transferase-like glycosyltransferase
MKQFVPHFFGIPQNSVPSKPNASLSTPGQECSVVSYAIPIIACVIAACIWMVRLFTSTLWLDETITYWIVKDDLISAIRRATFFQGTGPLHYILTWPFVHIFSRKEYALRIPSAICFFLLLLLLFKLTRLLLDKECAVIAVLLFICGEGILSSMANARCYSLGMLCITACAYCLVKWTNALKTRHLAYYFLISILAFYTHFLLVPLLVAFSIYICWFLFRYSGKKSWHVAGFAIGLMISTAAILPGFYQLTLLYGKKGIMSFAPMPTFDNLISALIPIRPLLFLTASTLILILVARHRLNYAFPAKAGHLGLIILWHLFPPLFLYFASWAFGASVFNARYFLWSMPATAILLSIIIRNVMPGKTRIISLIMAVPLLAYVETRKDVFTEGWADATQWLKSEQLVRNSPVLASTFLMESSSTPFLVGTESREYLLCPFSFYGLDAHPILALPFRFDQPGAEEYLQNSVWDRLGKFNRIFMIVRVVEIDASRASNANKIRSDKYLINQLSEKGWKAKDQKWFGSIAVIELINH